MKKLLIAAAAACVCIQVQAADFVRHSDDVPQTVPAKRGVQIVNFWATWCGPCRKEMPVMSKWYAAGGKKKAELIGIALDSKENVAKFLQAVPVAYPIWRYTGSNSRALMQSYGNKVGGLPFTVVRVPQCAQSRTLLGELTVAKMNQAVAEVAKSCGIK